MLSETCNKDFYSPSSACTSHSVDIFLHVLREVIIYDMPGKKNEYACHSPSLWVNAVQLACVINEVYEIADMLEAYHFGTGAFKRRDLSISPRSSNGTLEVRYVTASGWTQDYLKQEKHLSHLRDHSGSLWEKASHWLNLNPEWSLHFNPISIKPQ